MPVSSAACSRLYLPPVVEGSYCCLTLSSDVHGILQLSRLSRTVLPFPFLKPCVNEINYGLPSTLLPGSFPKLDHLIQLTTSAGSACVVKLKKLPNSPVLRWPQTHPGRPRHRVWRRVFQHPAKQLKIVLAIGVLLRLHEDQSSHLSIYRLLHRLLHVMFLTLTGVFRWECRVW